MTTQLTPIRIFIAKTAPFALFIVLIFIGTSCNKSERDADIETLSSREHSVAMLCFEGLIKEVHRFAVKDSILNTTGSSFSDNGCISSAALNKSFADFPVTLTINYDSNECADEVARSGRIRATFTEKYLRTGTEITASLTDVMIDGKSISGDISIENLGRSNGDWAFKWKVRNGLITAFNTNIVWRGSHTAIWTAGAETFDTDGDDVFTITEGTSIGKNSRGASFTATVTRHINSDEDCKWYSDGAALMEVSNLNDRTINYGVGDCDDLIVVRRNNTYFEVAIDY